MHLHHRFALFAALATFALTRPSGAQTLASADAVPGCLAAAPTDSLRTPIPDPTVFRHDAAGVFVMEAESVPIVLDWRAETTHTGYSAASYIRWSGRDLFNSPGSGVMTFRLWCEQPQRYRLEMHNRHNHSDPSLENDCFMSINGAAWLKIYSNDGRNSGVWNWHTRVDPGHGMFDFDLAAGMNTLRISGRSANFMLDRIHVFPVGMGQLWNLTLPESVRLGERPVIGTNVRVELGDPHDEAGLPAGVTDVFMLISSAASASSPCGLSVPGFGANGGVGELLLALTPAPQAYAVGIWNGPAQPAVVTLAVPNRPALVGVTVYLQGLLVTGGGPSLRAVLTERLDLRVGDS